MENLDLVLGRFPELKDRINQRYRDDTTFREVCEDYVEVWAALQALHHSQELPAERVGEVYEGLLLELEAEILTSL